MHEIWKDILGSGRLGRAQTLAAAQSELSVIAGRLATERPATNRRRGLHARGLEEWRTANVRGTTLMLLVAALLVFLVSSFIGRASRRCGVRRRFATVPGGPARPA